MHIYDPETDAYPEYFNFADTLLQHGSFNSIKEENPSYLYHATLNGLRYTPSPGPSDDDHSSKHSSPYITSENITSSDRCVDPQYLDSLANNNSFSTDPEHFLKSSSSDLRNSFSLPSLSAAQRAGWSELKSRLPFDIDVKIENEPVSFTTSRASLSHFLPDAHESFLLSCDMESDTDDDVKDASYIPDPEEYQKGSGSRRHARSAVKQHTGKVLYKASKAKAPGSTSSPPSKTIHNPPRRNVIADAATSALIRKQIQSKKANNRELKCPACPWVQRNRRFPDYRRHMETHITERFQCLGVPIEDAARYWLPADPQVYVRDDDGTKWIGGCGRICSRKDALKRHVDPKNKEGRCAHLGRTLKSK